MVRTLGSSAGGVGTSPYARYLQSPFVAGGTRAFGANTLLLSYIEIPFAVTIDAIGVKITVAGANLRMGIYADNGGVPDGGALLGETDTVAGIVGKNELDLAADVSLTAGTYWLGLNMDGALTVTIFSVYGPFGQNFSKTVNQAFGAFPNPCPATANALFGRTQYGYVRVV